MDNRSIIICILLAIITTNLIRVVPMLLIKGQISNRFVRSLCHAGRHDLPQYDTNHHLASLRYCGPPCRHYRSMAPFGTLSRGCHLLCHRLPDG